MEDYQPIVATAFYAVITGGIGFMIHFLSNLNGSISELNKQIAVVIEKMSDHDRRIQKLEQKADR